MESMFGKCSVCGETGEVRYIDIFITGSEGTHICHNCEMAIVGFINSLRSTVSRSKLAEMKRRKLNDRK